MKEVRFVLFAAAAVLVACAGQAPVAPTPPAANSAPAPAAPASAALAAAPGAATADAQSAVVYHKGYKRVLIKGEVRFCETDSTTGSRLTPSHQQCLTEDQVEMRERAQQSAQQAQTGGATGVKTTP